MSLKKALKLKAQQLKPVVMIGQNGLTDAVQNEIEVALTAHELVKIKIAGAEKADRQQMATAICDAHQAEFIDHIGHVVVIYRRKTQAS